MLTLKGPLGEYYLHAVIDQYFKFPEVNLVSSTNFKKLKPTLDRIFSTHGIPESLTTDNGPLYSSHEMAEYAKEMGFKLSPVSPEDPQCNGSTENFVKFSCKLLHTASVEGKDPRAELYKCRLHYRAILHTTAEKSPAEMLFGRRLQTKLPYYFKSNKTDEQKKTRDLHDQKKLKQKYYFD